MTGLSLIEGGKDDMLPAEPETARRPGGLAETTLCNLCSRTRNVEAVRKLLAPFSDGGVNVPI